MQNSNLRVWSMEKCWTCAPKQRGCSWSGYWLGYALFLAAVLVVVGDAAAFDDTTKDSSHNVSGVKPAFIDQMIEDAWKKAGVNPSKVASDEEFLRRAYSALVGPIPHLPE